MVKAVDVLGLGAVAVDDFIYVARYPPPDAKARVLRRDRQCGGLTATALVTAARLGARCAYAGVLGRDELSGFALGCLKREGVDVAWVQRRPAAGPGYSTIIVDQERGTRNIFSDVRRVVGASTRTPAALIASSRVLLIDHIGVPGMIRAARLARRAGIPVVADFERDHDPQFRRLMALADHLIISRSFAAALTGFRSPEMAVLKLARPDREVSVVTCGEEGCWYLAQGWSKPRHQPAFRVKVADTTGCGDVFHGAYAFALARGMRLEERIRFAAATAALKAARPGGQDGVPSLRAVRRFLAVARVRPEDGPA